MARRDTDGFGDLFANLNNPVGSTGNPDDVMVVQGLLQLHWEFSTAAQHLVPSKPPVDGATSKTNTILIAQFQKEIMKRPKPPGFVNPATRFDVKSLSGSTIWMLNQRATVILAASGRGKLNPVDYLITNFSALTGPLGAPRERHMIQNDTR